MQMSPAVMDQGLWLHPITTGCFGQALPLPQGRADTQGPMPKEPGGAGGAGGTAQESREQGPAWRGGAFEPQWSLGCPEVREPGLMVRSEHFEHITVVTFS